MTKICSAQHCFFVMLPTCHAPNVKNRALALEVLQKPEIAFPRSVGSIICFASHAAWRFDFSLFQPLSAKTLGFRSLSKSRRRAPRGLVVGHGRFRDTIVAPRGGTLHRLQSWRPARAPSERFVYLTSWDLGREGSLRSAALHAQVPPGTAKSWYY